MMYIELKDYTLAKKYVDLLSHSLCNGKWLREHYVELESIKGLEPEYVMIGNQFVLQDFYKDLSSLVTRYPDEKKYVDISKERLANPFKQREESEQRSLF